MGLIMKQCPFRASQASRSRISKPVPSRLLETHFRYHTGIPYPYTGSEITDSLPMYKQSSDIRKPCSAFVSPRSGDLRKVVPDGLLGIFHSCMGYYKCVSEMTRPLRVTHYKGFFKMYALALLASFGCILPYILHKLIKRSKQILPPGPPRHWLYGTPLPTSS